MVSSFQDDCDIAGFTRFFKSTRAKGPANRAEPFTFRTSWIVSVAVGTRAGQQYFVNYMDDTIVCFDIGDDDIGTVTRSIRN